ncbi:restriction endonuclease subunit S [Nostoc sp. CCY 9925]|uniref:restriction endonuclease subunit S n=1 Tax=Nostoc sp. CCY 9925 TaxID=3103865 RepID=UPI0039C6187C
MQISRASWIDLRNRIDPQFYHPQNLKDVAEINKFKTTRLDDLRYRDTKISYGVLKPRFVESNFKLVRIQNFEDPFLDIDSCEGIAEEQFLEYQRSECCEGDILIAIGGYVGRAAIIPKLSSVRLNINQHIARFRPNTTKKFDFYFLLSYLISSIGYRQLNRYVSGAVQAGINLEDLREIPIPTPIIHAQTYIGDKVRLAERLRDRSRILAADIQDKMQECFYSNPKPRPSKHHRINSDVLTANRLEYEFYTPLGLWADAEIRGSQWPYKRLANISLRIKDGPGGWGVSTSDYVNIGVPVIRAINLIDGECDLTDCVYITPKKHKELASHTVKQNSVLLSVRGTIGRAAVFESDEYKEVNLNAAVVTIDCNNEILPHFLAEFLNTEVGKIQSQRMANGAVQLNMNLEETGNNLIVVPPKDFQEKIVSLRQNRLATKSFSEKFTTAAKLLVEALIEGKLTEEELKIAQEALQKGDREPDKAILSRLTRKGYDIKDEPPLFPDLDLLYQTIDQLKADEQGE